jgi:hypothetical protein
MPCGGGRDESRRGVGLARAVELHRQIDAIEGVAGEFRSVKA